MSKLDDSITNIHFFTDNATAAKDITNTRPHGSQVLSKNFQKCIDAFLDKNPNHKVTIEWCPSHTDIKENDRADELAKQGCKLASALPFVSTYEFEKRKAKDQLARRRIEESNNTAKRGRFAMANRVQPSTEPTKH
jgi:ribonuclease HI